MAVRCALSQHLATLAELAASFLDMASSGVTGEEVGSCYSCYFFP